MRPSSVWPPRRTAAGFDYGDVGFLGPMGGKPLSKLVVDMAGS
jgi:hypothetical protein